MTATVSLGGDARTIRSLVDFAIDSLPAMRLADGAFCFERRLGDPRPVGRSVRYTLMVELGLLRARAAGYVIPFDIDELDALAWRELDAGRLTPGDIGLLMWLDARREGGHGEQLAAHLNVALAAGGGLRAQVGMELAWIVIGLAHHLDAAAGRTGARLLSEALDQLLLRRRAPSSLIRHFGDGRWRGRFPNFATQIYSVLALAVVARQGLDDRALSVAVATADRLLELQLADGGWPWLFDADRGTVVERYEIYSVHQDAMAPMALFELWEVCREPRYLDAVARSLAWIPGNNELGIDMVDRGNGLVLRSIRRKRGPDRFWLAAQTGASLAGVSIGAANGRMVETNPTDRPYHFGWVLEAWCGREGMLGGDEPDQAG
jgi:hypothetical protein